MEQVRAAVAARLIEQSETPAAPESPVDDVPEPESTDAEDTPRNRRVARRAALKVAERGAEISR